MSRSYAFSVLLAEDRRVRDARKGERNDTLYRAARRLGNYAATGEISSDLVVDMLTAAGLVNGLGQLEIDRTIASGLDAGRSAPRCSPRRITNRATAGIELDRIERLVCDQPWLGDDGRLTYLTLRCVIRLARSFGGPGQIPLSNRRLAAEMGTYKNRAGDGLTLAGKAGWLTISTKATATQPAIYDLRVPAPVAFGQNTKAASPAPIGGILNSAGACHDAFHWKALGRIGAIALDHLDRHGDWLTRPELSAATGLRLGTLNKHLRPKSPLVAQNLVETRRGGLRATPTLSVDDLDRVAANLGTSGENDKLRQRIADEYRNLGRIDTEGNWCDPITGDPVGGRPDWLPEVSNHAV